MKDKKQKLKNFSDKNMDNKVLLAKSAEKKDHANQVNTGRSLSGDPVSWSLCTQCKTKCQYLFCTKVKYTVVMNTCFCP